VAVSSALPVADRNDRLVLPCNHPQGYARTPTDNLSASSARMGHAPCRVRVNTHTEAHAHASSCDAEPASVAIERQL